MTGAEMAFIIGVLLVALAGLAGCTQTGTTQAYDRTGRVTMYTDECAITWEAERSNRDEDKSTSLDSPGL